MKTQTLLCLQVICLMVCFRLQAQVILPGGIINTYHQVSFIQNDQVTLAKTPNLNPCDKVLIIQMKGADMDSSNTGSYGTINSYGDAGNYEFATILSVTGNVVTLTAPVARTYDPVLYPVQMVYMPVYYSTITIGGVLTCAPWNGTTGGVLALQACEINMRSDMDVSGRGFRGGAVSSGLYTSAPNYNFVEPYPSSYAAEKGEGIFRHSNATRVGRGCNASGGGGGNNINAGGAGGSNWGAGGTGGDIFTSVSTPPNTYLACGGIGGQPLAAGININNQVFLGGGGGAGHDNNGQGTSGGNGGGIVFLESLFINGNGFSILADGDDVPAAGIDGQGGGGAGGSVLLNLPAGGIMNCNISVTGGDGGTDTHTGPDCHGKGGGGGGGIIWSTITLPAAPVPNVSGGAPGLYTNPASNCWPGSGGATAGANGFVLTGLNAPNPDVCGQTCVPKPLGLANKAADISKVGVFPNPSGGQVTLDGLKAGEPVQIQVSDVSGKVVFEKTVTPSTSSYNLNLPTEQSAYFITLKNADKQEVHKKIMIAK